MIADHRGDSILVRWAPDKSDIWFTGTNYGYNLYRFSGQSIGDIPLSTPKFLGTIRPKEKEEWIAEAELEKAEDAYFNIALQCIHGDWESIGIEGGLFASILKNEEMTNRFSFNLLAADLDFPTAISSGLGYLDKEVSKDSIYFYAIEPVYQDSLGRAVRVMHVLADYEDRLAYPKIEAELVKREGGVTFLISRDAFNPYYTAYWFERSKDGVDFEKLNNTPYVHPLSDDPETYTRYISFSDSVENYVPYHYRIRGITSFGELSEYSDIMIGYGIDQTPPPAPALDTIFYLDESSIQILWRIDSVPDLGGFIIEKGYHIETTFWAVSDTLAEDVRSFIDEDCNTVLPHYYKITAIDTSGNKRTTFPFLAFVKDTTPPAPPTGLKATVDSTGLVTLSWDRNRELDLHGYKVFWSNAIDHEFSNLTGLAINDTVFYHQIDLNTRTPYIFYRVMAQDIFYNISGLSEILAVKRPDTIPPLAPVFHQYFIEEDSITVLWHPSTSEDATLQHLYNSEDGEDWELVRTFTKEISQFTFEDLRSTTSIGMHVKIEAEDDAGLRTVCPQNLYLPLIKSKLIQGIFNLQVTDQDGHAALSWDYAGPTDIKFMIYRYISGGSLDLFQELDSSERSTLDPLQFGDEPINYILKVKSANGKESRFSEAVVYQAPKR